MPLIERYSRDTNKRFFQTMNRLYRRNSRKKNANLQTAVGYPGPETSGTGIVSHTGLADMPSSSVADHDGRYYTETELGAITTGAGASLIGVEDAGGYYTGDDVEAVLQEVGADLAAMGPLHEQHWTLMRSSLIDGVSTNTPKVNIYTWYHPTYGGANGLTYTQYTSYSFTNHETSYDYTKLEAIYKGTVISADPWAAIIDNSTQTVFSQGFRKKSNEIVVTARIRRSGSTAADALTRVRIVVCDQDGANSSSATKLVSAVGTSWEDLSVTLADAAAYGSEMKWALELVTDNGTFTGAINATSTLHVHHIAVTQT